MKIGSLVRVNPPFESKRLGELFMIVGQRQSPIGPQYRCVSAKTGQKVPWVPAGRLSVLA